MVFVLFCWGSTAFHKQALLAVKSILERSHSARVLVFASRPALLTGGRIEVVPITKFDISNWKGPLGYILRVKIQIIKKALLNVDDNEPICFIDSDMYCCDVPEELVVPGNNVLMFNYEGRVSNSFHEKLHKFLLRSRELLTNNGYMDLLPDFKMYNSGLIYMPAASWRMRALEKVLELTDFLCLHFPQQMYWLEQASFSYVLPKFSEIGISKGFEHYWGLNSEVGYLLERMPLKEIEELAKSKYKFDEFCKEAKSIQGTFSNKARLFLRKQIRSIRKNMSLLKTKYYASY